jgi:protein-L-isoaspartate(D-aspartate) O-methyltransferase
MSEADFTLARDWMVREQLERRGIRSRRVLEAMSRVPRDRFLTPRLAPLAYADRALGIECGQTISQPYMVALMTQELDLDGSESVLEIGTGSGYQTAILAELAGKVVTVERHAPLSVSAAAVLDELGYSNVRTIVGDGSKGFPEEAPYDRILVTAAAEGVPAALLQQLADPGILVIPVGDEGMQMLKRIDFHDGRLTEIDLTPCRFVPLVGEGEE